MCGIMGYVGPQEAAPILLDGLRRLEYRGYDSAGVAVHDGVRVGIRKAEGKLARLSAIVDEDPPAGSTGIGHTRWATHGPPTDFNAHPHTDPAGDVAVVHNGIIENFLALREELGEGGAEFASDTDTELIAHLIAEEYDDDLLEAVRRAVRRAEGAYALVAMSRREPGRIVAVRMISPLVVGIGDGETFLASDIPAILHHTREILVVENGEIVDVTPEGVRIETLDGRPVERERLEVTWDAEQAERGGFAHFMLKEIYEQPDVIAETLSGRLLEAADVALDGVAFPKGFAGSIDKIWITACGTAYHAGLVGKEIFERLLRIPVDVVFAHELRYRDPIIDPNSLTIAISQSGETADTLAAARLAQERGSRLLAITNVVGSTLSRMADDVLYTRAGPEIAVASTKAYLAMLVGEYLLAVAIGRERGFDDAAAESLIAGLRHLPAAAEQALSSADAVAAAAKYFSGHEDVYFIGRGLDYAVAMEGSLKMKEISYIHSEAMPAGELKHGTLALVTEGTPVVVVLTQGEVYDKTVSALQEVKARGAFTLAVAYEDDTEAPKLADEVLTIPRVPDSLGPVLAAIPLQLLAYWVAAARGHDIDQPRNLAKSVTVE